MPESTKTGGTPKYPEGSGRGFGQNEVILHTVGGEASAVDSLKNKKGKIGTERRETETGVT